MGYRPTPLNTGYDQVLSQRTDDLFATTAEQKGKVLEVSPKAVVVEYDDGLVTTVELGRRYGKASGAVIPHEVAQQMVRAHLVALVGRIRHPMNQIQDVRHVSPGCAR